MTTRFYSGVSPQNALEAARTIFELVDDDDTLIQMDDTRLMADRRVFAYLVLAVHDVTWPFQVEVRAAADGSGTHVRMLALPHRDMSVYPQLSSTTVIPMGGNTFMAAHVARPEQDFGPSGPFLQYKSTYKLFFDRMDYLLGKSNHWPSCDEAGEVAKAVAKQAWKESNIVGQDSVHPMCDLADDLHPDQAADAELMAQRHIPGTH